MAAQKDRERVKAKTGWKAWMMHRPRPFFFPSRLPGCRLSGRTSSAYGNKNNALRGHRPSLCRPLFQPPPTDGLGLARHSLAPQGAGPISMNPRPLYLGTVSLR